MKSVVQCQKNVLRSAVHIMDKPTIARFAQWQRKYT